MGYYINPSETTKERWLAENGVRITTEEARKHSAGEELVVCLVDNGAFTAAGICYDNRERDAFIHPDERPRVWYRVEKTKLKPWL